ncbi:hypothetical protein [Rhodanobacter lindaniclasticus]
MPETGYCDPAMQDHGGNGYCPSEDGCLGQHEAATLPAAKTSLIVVDRMWENPSELIPSNNQISKLRAMLPTRPDAAAPELRKTIVAREDYLKVSRSYAELQLLFT